MTDLRTAAQQALEALKTGGWNMTTRAIADLERALAQQAEPVQDQDVENAIEAAYWQFDCRKKGLNEWASAPQSARDAFKAEARKLVRGHFPTRQAQDTKREMLAVADAFIRGKRAALAQQAEPLNLSDPAVRKRLATQWGYVPAAQAEPVEPVAWVASKDGRVIYDDASTDDGLLRVSGDFENDEQRSRYAQRIVDKLNAAPPQRKPLTEEEIYRATGHCGVSKYTAINITRAVELAHGIKEN